MDILKQLQQFKSIQADPAYTQASRRAILNADSVPTPLTPFRFLLHLVERGPAIVLTAIFLFLIIGGVSAWKIISPFDGLDPGSLRAEAEAIDVQIQLTDISYQEPLRNAETTPQTAETPAQGSPEAEPQESSLELTPPFPLTIDEALDKLSE